MLDLQKGREGPPPKDAATILVLRDGDGGLEVFCVERNKKSRFMGGAIVFPGGKVEPEDLDEGWRARATAPWPAHSEAFAAGLSPLGIAVAACREALEEAALLHVEGGALGDAEVRSLRARLAAGEATLGGYLESRGLRLDVGALRPFARWVTPVAESRRFDTRFFLAEAPPEQPGAHDDHETMASFWARPAHLLGRFDRGDVQLAPPTHRSLEVLADVASVKDAFAWAASACLEAICPEVVAHEDDGGTTVALVLPGDPEHSLAEVRVPGASRYVLRGERWRPGRPGRTGP